MSFFVELEDVFYFYELLWFKTKQKQNFYHILKYFKNLTLLMSFKTVIIKIFNK